MLVLYGVVAVVHLIATLAGWDDVATPTQWLLMPVLAAALWTLTPGAQRTRLVWLVLVALGFSWLGDSVPSLLDGDAAFLSLVGLFLCAQIVYIVAFWPYRAQSVLRKPLVVVYVAMFGVLLAACWSGAGDLLVPIIGYGLCLGLMAVLSTGIHRLAGIGGALFLVSDGLIALGRFADWYDPPVKDFWVMLTYISAQALLVLGVRARHSLRAEPARPR